jgi:hypothetical protein
MPAEITLPVFVRVGDSEETHLGDVTFPVEGNEVKDATARSEMAAFYRALADALERKVAE